jgi:putative transposase
MCRVLDRHFAADRPNQVWLAVITYIPTQVSWVYLAVLLDLFSRRIVGWAMDRYMIGDLTIRVLKMVLSHRLPTPGIMQHSDQGSQYTSRDYQALLA